MIHTFHFAVIIKRGLNLGTKLLSFLNDTINGMKFIWKFESIRTKRKYVHHDINLFSLPIYKPNIFLKKVSKAQNKENQSCSHMHVKLL